MALPVFATDEDILLRAPGDYHLLCPRDQVLARGTDGTLVGPWGLQSASVDFQARGVRPGHVAQLIAPGSGGMNPARLYVVDSASPASASLRVPGQAAGQGEPPSPPNSAIRTEFLIATLGPQIADVTTALDARFRLARDLPADAQVEIRAVIVLTVLERRYQEVSRCHGEHNDSFVAKARALANERDERLARLAIRLDSSSNPAAPHPAPWGTRLSR
ncbi:MAG: hypothetical protein U0800_00055 [Isosphaeraceae bacterium]